MEIWLVPQCLRIIKWRQNETFLKCCNEYKKKWVGTGRKKEGETRDSETRYMNKLPSKYIQDQSAECIGKGTGHMSLHRLFTEERCVMWKPSLYKHCYFTAFLYWATKEDNGHLDFAKIPQPHHQALLGIETCLCPPSFCHPQLLLGKSVGGEYVKKRWNWTWACQNAACNLIVFDVLYVM